jgi:outer membrane protein TolC
MFSLIPIIIVFLFTSNIHAQVIAINSLHQAETIALKIDPLLKSLEFKQQSNKQQSSAANYWQDPKIKFGINNLPTDSFNFDQEAMTQLKVGISQQFPLGDSLTIRSLQFNLKAEEKKYQFQLRERDIKKQVREIWSKILLEKYSLDVLDKNKKLINEFRGLIESNYASGRSSQQNIFQTELKLSLIDDKIDDTQMRLNIALDNLQRWTGQTIALSAFNTPLNQLLENNFLAITTTKIASQKNQLIKHPDLLIIQQKIAQLEQQIKLKQQDLKAQWGMEMSYGKRFGDNPNGSSRSDFVSALVNVKYPLWGKQKQHKKISANQSLVSALKMQFQNKNIELTNQLEKIQHRLAILNKRRINYQDNIVYKSLQNTDASLNAYQNGVGDFKDLLKARETQLTISLSRIKLDYQLLNQKTQLLYLLGDKE